MAGRGKMTDIVEWDVENWGKAIGFWDADLKGRDLAGKRVLDLGGRNGGLSLYWALRGAEVVCSDISEAGFPNARKLHKKYGVSKRVTYEVVDATNIPYEDEFDIISFKSVLGGVGYGDQFQRQRQMMDSIHTALKAGGACYFAENLTASRLHQLARRAFVKWGGKWRYIGLDELPSLAERFSMVQYKAFGFLGVFGRRQWMASLLGKADTLLDRCIRDRDKYIVSCILRK